MEPDTPERLLPADALAGVNVGISVSDSPDLGRLGLVELHLRLALGEVTRAVLLAGGGLVYGGRLDPAGYTTFLQSEIEKYSRRDRPLHMCLAWQEHRELSLVELDAAERDAKLYGSIDYLDVTGSPVDKATGRDNAPVIVDDPEVRRQGLTALRRHLTDICDARVLVGGKRRGFQGVMPGLVEETLLAIQAGHPIFLAAGFGGAAFDVARALGLDVDGWPALSDGGFDWLQQLGVVAENGWTLESNGLTRDENLRLAGSHRPSDIATLVALGLGRLRKDGRLGGGT